MILQKKKNMFRDLLLKKSKFPQKCFPKKSMDLQKRAIFSYLGSTQNTRMLQEKAGPYGAFWGTLSALSHANILDLRTVLALDLRVY